MNARAHIERYESELASMPPSGGGGCHVALLRIARRGRRAGLAPDRVAADLAANVHGTRKITRREIDAAVAKAFETSFAASPFTRVQTAQPRPAVDGTVLLNKIVERGSTFDEARLWEASPVRLDWTPKEDAIQILRRIYAPEDRLFLGHRYDGGAAAVHPVSEWIKQIERGVLVPEHIVPNPLTGGQGQTKDGKPSFRADSCVARFRFAVVEFDSIPRESQIQFWAGVRLPVVVLIDSGGKSVHGWVRIDARNTDEWTHRVESKLFDLLTVVGADGACKNEGRLSRMPGHFRGEKGQWQRVLYLNPSGGPVLP